jgi:hypothetical protein
MHAAESTLPEHATKKHAPEHDKASHTISSSANHANWAAKRKHVDNSAAGLRAAVQGQYRMHDDPQCPSDEFDLEFKDGTDHSLLSQMH